VDYHTILFTSNSPTNHEEGLRKIEAKLNMSNKGIEVKLNIRDSANLDRLPNLKEVKIILHDIDPIKAHDPDGFHTPFCQIFRYIKRLLCLCKGDWQGYIKLRGGQDKYSVNSKTQATQDNDTFESTSLCNVLYKILSKTIPHR